MGPTKSVAFFKKPVLVIIAVILTLLLGFVLALALATPADGKIADGVTVSGISIGNMTVSQAEKALEDIAAAHQGDTLSITYDGTGITLTPAELSAVYDAEKTVNDAYSIGRSDNIFVRFRENFYSLFNINTDITYHVEFDKSKLSSVLASFLPISDSLYATYEIFDDVIVVTNGQSVVSVDPVLVESQVADRLENFDFSPLEITKTQANPVPLDMDALYDTLSSDTADAYYVREDDKIIVSPHLDKISFDINAAKELSSENPKAGMQYEIPITRTPATMKAEELNDALFRDLLGSYSSSYATSNANRSNNVALSAAKINGTTYLPGETFSYNGVVGKRTLEAGFKYAGAYVNGETVDEIGGGICQTSSTLYNAVLYANLEIVSRTCHQLTVGYVPLGRDATVDYGNIDFVFRNNTEYPIKIEAYTTSNKMLYVNIYGTKTDDYEVVLETACTGTIPYTTKTEDVDWLVTGETQVKTQGSNGYTYVLYRVVKSGGEIISRELEAKSRYNPTTEVILNGTAEPAISTEITDAPDASPSPSASPEITPTDEPESTEAPENATPDAVDTTDAPKDSGDDTVTPDTDITPDPSLSDDDNSEEITD